MPIALDPNCPEEFVFPSERGLDKSKQTVILLKPMLQSDLIEFHEKFGASEESEVPYREVLGFVSRFVVGWRNFRNANGDVVEFTGDPNADMDRFSVKDVHALMSGLMEKNTIDDIELKNLPSGQ